MKIKKMIELELSDQEQRRCDTYLLLRTYTQTQVPNPYYSPAGTYQVLLSTIL